MPSRSQAPARGCRWPCPSESPRSPPSPRSCVLAPALRRPWSPRLQNAAGVASSRASGARAPRLMRHSGSAAGRVWNRAAMTKSLARARRRHCRCAPTSLSASPAGLALLVTALAALSILTTNAFVDTFAAVAAAEHTVQSGDKLADSLDDAEDASRGYLLTAADEYQQSFERDAARVSEAYARLRGSAGADPERGARLDELKRLIDSRMQSLRQGMARMARGSWRRRAAWSAMALGRSRWTACAAPSSASSPPSRNASRATTRARVARRCLMRPSTGQAGRSRSPPSSSHSPCSSPVRAAQPSARRAGGAARRGGPGIRGAGQEPTSSPPPMPDCRTRRARAGNGQPRA